MPPVAALTVWAGIDVGKTHHWVEVVDATTPGSERERQERERIRHGRGAYSANLRRRRSPHCRMVRCLPLLQRTTSMWRSWATAEY